MTYLDGTLPIGVMGSDVVEATSEPVLPKPFFVHVT